MRVIVERIMGMIDMDKDSILFLIIVGCLLYGFMVSSNLDFTWTGYVFWAWSSKLAYCVVAGVLIFRGFIFINNRS
ncbi:MAG: hypothetical protein FWH54_00825 [Methanobrevibacter sp.]|nr:hypothetical protein [Methanobrevibacter sp.]